MSRSPVRDTGSIPFAGIPSSRPLPPAGAIRLLPLKTCNPNDKGAWMELDLKGKAVLITGGSKGIGFACAAAFAAEGARIAICSRSQDNVSRSVAALPGTFGIAADLTDAVA